MARRKAECRAPPKGKLKLEKLHNRVFLVSFFVSLTLMSWKASTGGIRAAQQGGAQGRAAAPVLAGNEMGARARLRSQVEARRSSLDPWPP